MVRIQNKLLDKVPTKIHEENYPYNAKKPNNIDFSPYFLKGKTEDFMALNYRSETRWYRINYNNIKPYNHPVIEKILKNSKKKFIIRNLFYFIPLIIGILILIPLFVMICLNILNQSEANIDHNIESITGILIVLTSYYLQLFVFSLLEEGGNFKKALSNLPMINTVGDQFCRDMRDKIRKHPFLVPDFEHIITISMYEDTTGIRNENFVGYQLKKTLISKQSRDYWLNAKLSSGKVIEILPVKSIPHSSQKMLYTAINSSLLALGRNINKNGKYKGEFVYGLGFDNVEMKHSSDTQQIRERHIENFIDTLSFADIIQNRQEKRNSVHWSKNPIEYDIKHAYSCLNCEILIPFGMKFCHFCDNPAPRCIICFSYPEDIEVLFQMKCCQSYAHKNHLETWFNNEVTCPYCKIKDPKYVTFISDLKE